MVIPATPVKRSFQRQPPLQQDVLQKPFPFMMGRQAVVSCARMALLQGLRLLNHPPGKVHVPAYCCQSVLLPLEQLGLKIRFYDVGKKIEPILDRAELEERDVFLLIHYFGIPQDTQSVSQMCQGLGMVLVEDCAHTLPDPEVKHKMGSEGAFSVFSLRKQLPVPDGGVLVVNDPNMIDRMEGRTLPRLRRISAQRWMVTALDRFAFTVGWPNTMLLKDLLRAKIGSDDNSFNMQLSDDTATEVSPVTVRVLGQIDFGAVIKVRKNNYHYLLDRIVGMRGVTIPFTSLSAGAVPQAFPVLLEDADGACKFMRKKGVTVGHWPRSEDMPGSIAWSDFPGAFSLMQSLLLLPVHQDLNNSCLDKIVQILKDAI